MLDEARAVLPALARDAKSPAGRDGVVRVVAKRFSLYPQPERSETEWAAWWSDYVAILEDCPEGALEAGMLAWVKTSAQFLPKPGELLALAGDTPNSDARAVYRARKAIEAADARGPLPGGQNVPMPEVKRIGDQDRARIRRMAREFGEQIPEGKTAALRPNFAATDEHGISDGLRELVAKQQRGEA